MPISLATRAITGAAPVPVPPPMPAVMKSMCAPVMLSLMLLHRLFGGTRPGLGLAAGAQARGAQLHQRARIAAVQGLRVGVGADELHALHALVDHVLDGIAAAAADADHLDLGALVKFVDHFDGHVSLLVKSCSCRG
jgi:hypothetical protein